MRIVADENDLTLECSAMDEDIEILDDDNIQEVGERSGSTLINEEIPSRNGKLNVNCLKSRNFEYPFL